MHVTQTLLGIAQSDVIDDALQSGAAGVESDVLDWTLHHQVCCFLGGAHEFATHKLATHPRRHLHAPQPSPTHAGRPKTRPPRASNASRHPKLGPSKAPRRPPDRPANRNSLRGGVQRPAPSRDPVRCPSGDTSTRGQRSNAASRADQRIHGAEKTRRGKLLSNAHGPTNASTARKKHGADWWSNKTRSRSMSPRRH